MSENPELDFIPIAEETLTVSKRKVSGGRVRITTRTEEIDHTLPVEVLNVDVEVTRVPVDRKITEAPDVVTQGDLTIIPVVEERLVMVRELYLVEEIHVRRRESTETLDVNARTRRQAVQIDRIPPGQDATPNKDDQDDL